MLDVVTIVANTVRFELQKSKTLNSNKWKDHFFNYNSDEL